MVVLDSNVWIAFFHVADSQHEKAAKIFTNLPSKILLPDYVIIEVASILAIRASKKTADLFLERVIDNEAIDVLIFDEVQFYDFCERFRQLPNNRLSFVDSTLLSLARAHPVVTFDKHLKQEIEKHL